MWIMFYHDTQGQVRYFSVEDDLEKAINELLKRLIDQLSIYDDEEMRLRRTLERTSKNEQREVRRTEEEK